MSKLQELINELCPDGVEWKKLGDIGFFFNGLTGKTKEDFKDGNAKFITYRNIYSNPSLNLDIEETVRINKDEKQHTVRYGDILFTGSSETPDECGMSSVVTAITNEELYLNSFCFGLRLYHLEKFDVHYLKHILRSINVREQIAKTASGVTRYNVSKKRFAKIEIPIPPLAVQTEIVRILDHFTNLAAELQAELQARKEQYEYYRNKLLIFNEIGGGIQVEWKKMSEICDIPKQRIAIKNISLYVGVENLLQNRQGVNKLGDMPNADNAIKFITGDILIGNIRPYLKKIWHSDCEGGTNGDVVLLRIKDECKKQINERYLYQNLASERFFEYDNKWSKGAKMPRGDKDKIMDFLIPLPPLAEQRRIAEILDRFEALTTDLSEGLPAEIAAVQEQYEYYRNKLLTFNRLSA